MAAELGPPQDDLVEHTAPARDCVCGAGRAEVRGVHPSGQYSVALGDVWVHRRLDGRDREEVIRDG